MLLLLPYPSGELVCYVIKREKVKYHIIKPHHTGEAFFFCHSERSEESFG